MNYDILDETITIKQNMNKWFIPFFIVAFLGLPLSFLLSSSIMGILMVATFAIGIAGNYYESNPAHDKTKVIGEVYINEESISIKYGQTILVSDIKSIVLESNGYQGMNYFASSSDTGLSGITELKISDHLNDVTVIRFLIKNKAELSCLKDVIRTYYIRKISIKETFHYKMKALLLEPLKSYAETQRIKKELGL